MKTINKRPRKLMRAKNRERVNRLRNQQTVILTPVFVLVLIKLGLEDITTPMKMVERLLLHGSKLDGNVHFPVTNPTFTDLKLMGKDLGDTIIKIDAGDKSLIPHRDTLMLEADNMIRQLSYDIQNQSKGNSEKIQSAGFSVRKGKGASQTVVQVTNLKVKVLGNGKLKLNWKRISNSVMNFIEITDNPVTGVWSPKGKTHRASFIAEGLTPGNVYYLRVYASNDLGDGNPSDPAEQRVL